MDCNLPGVGDEGAVQHSPCQDEEEIDGEISALEDGHDVVEVPKDDDRDEQKAEDV